MLLPSNYQLISALLQLYDVHGGGGAAEPQSSTLADCVVRQAVVLAEHAAVDVDDLTGCHRIRRPISEKATVIVINYEAQIHRIVLGCE